MGTLMVGHARVCITPKEPVRMGGYAKRTEKSVGVHDDLFANAIAFSDGSTKSLLIAMDATMIAEPETERIKQAIRERTGVAADHVLVNASHTHSAPQLCSRYSGEQLPFEKDHFAGLLAPLADMAAQAIADLKPASLREGVAPLDIGCNRREIQPDGTMKLGNNPAGPRLSEVTVWKFEREGAPAVALWSSANHGTTVGGDNLYLSAEWMGDAVRKLEAAHPDLKAVFVQGCCGDQNTYKQKGAPSSFDEVAKHGSTACTEVEQALQSAQPLTALPLTTVVRAGQLPAADGAVQECRLAGLRLGEAVLIGIGGEPFVEYALHVRRQLAHAMVLGYTDGYMSYIPTEEAFFEGGYELLAWSKQKGCKAWDPGVEFILKAEMDRMLQELGAARVD